MKGKLPYSPKRPYQRNEYVDGKGGKGAHGAYGGVKASAAFLHKAIVVLNGSAPRPANSTHLALLAFLWEET